MFPNNDMIVKWHSRDRPVYYPLACKLHINAYHMCSLFPSMKYTMRSFLKEGKQFKL